MIMLPFLFAPGQSAPRDVSFLWLRSSGPTTSNAFSRLAPGQPPVQLDRGKTYAMSLSRGDALPEYLLAHDQVVWLYGAIIVARRTALDHSVCYCAPRACVVDLSVQVSFFGDLAELVYI